MRTISSSFIWCLVFSISLWKFVVNQTTETTETDKSIPNNALGPTKKPKVSWVHPISRDDPKVKDILMSPVRQKLKIVGPFLAAHKYFAVDPRQIRGKIQRKGGLHKHFPNPRIVQMEPSLTLACEESELACINEIFKKARDSKSVSKIQGKEKLAKRHNFWPFESELDIFRYRATAAYYMCWFTELKSPLLRFVDDKADGCLDSLSMTVEAANRTVVDFRSQYGGNQSEWVSLWTCAFLWFCPDPCYGKSSMGNVRDEISAPEDPLNPCKTLKNKACTWSEGQNVDFEDMTRNRLNFSCDCASEKPGHVWSSRFSLCIDQDECYDQVGQCAEDKICRNTVGSYSCGCRRGYRMDKSDGTCVRSPIFKGSLDKIRLRGEKKAGNVPFWVKFLEKIMG